MFTEKAYPEDEIVFTTTLDPSAGHAIEGEFQYEKRVGSTGMFEMPSLWPIRTAAPYRAHRTGPESPAAWRSGTSRSATNASSTMT